MAEPEPPWIALPGLSPADAANQGAAEAYVTLEWLPFWQGLPAADKAAYLDRWDASEAWRAAIATRYDWDPDEMAADLAESEAWLAARRAERKKRPWWRPWD